MESNKIKEYIYKKKGLLFFVFLGFLMCLFSDLYLSHQRTISTIVWGIGGVSICGALIYDIYMEDVRT
jgi:hypothetical protein